MASCANCGTVLGRRSDGRGYLRYSLERATSDGITARDALSSITGAKFTPVLSKRHGQFLCPSCWSDLNDTVRYKKSLQEFCGRTEEKIYIGEKRRRTSNGQSSSVKKPRFTSTPLKKRKAAVKSLFKQKSTRASKWDSIISSINNRKYSSAIRGLYDATKGSRKVFIKVVNQIVRKEVSELLKPGTILPLCYDVDIPSIRNFSWDDTLNQLQENAPLFFNVLRSSITRKSNESTLLKGKTVNLKPKLGIAFACLLHAQAPIKASFLPTLLSIQLWRGNLKRETIQQLAKLGLCKGYIATLQAVDNIREDFDVAATTCKNDIESQLGGHSDPANMSTMWEEDLGLSIANAITVPNIEDEVNAPSDDEITQETKDTENVSGEESSDEREDDDDETVSSDEDEDEDAHEQMENNPLSEDSDSENKQGVSFCAEEPLRPGFTLCWDNVGKKVTTRHPTATSTNKYINMALGYMTINRVTTTNLPWKFDEIVKNAADITHKAFIPSEQDVKNLKSRMEVIVGQILSRHLKFFRDNYSDCAIPYIVHEYTAQSCHRSVLINLGVFDVDPSSTQGAVTIYETLQKYVPSIQGKPFTTVVYGDGLSCERGNDAHRARSNGLNPWERLEGCEPGVQEFHKEMLLLQDYYDIFFKGSSAADKGTLSYLKNVFNFRQVKSDVSDNFTHAWELMCVATEGFVCLQAMALLGLEDADDEPKNSDPPGAECDYEGKKRIL